MKHRPNYDLYLVICCLVFLLVPLTTARQGDGVSIGRYREGLRGDDDAPYPYHNGESRKLYDEPLYANANESVMVRNPKRIAIIGGGIAGITIAHQLRDDYCYSTPPEVTIFEQNDRLGGRIHTVRSYGDGCDGLEVGGELFETDRWSQPIHDLARDVGVEVDKINTGGGVTVWDGEKLSWSWAEDPQDTWTNILGHIWRDGRSLRYWVSFVKRVWDSSRETPFVYLFQPYYFSSAATEAREPPAYAAGLKEISRSLGIDLKRELHRVAMRSGGGERLLKRLVIMAQASLKLNSTVTRIKRYEDLTFDVDWKTEVETPDGQTETLSHMEHFDSVIIAAPFHLANIAIDPPLPSVPEKAEYHPLHVTHFISYHRLDPTTFNLPSTVTVPDMIWSVQNHSHQHPKSGGLTPSFLTLTHTPLWYLDGCMAEQEHLYKVISREPFSDENISTLFKKNSIQRQDITFPNQSCYAISEDRTLGAPGRPMRPEFAEKLTDEEKEDEYFIVDLEKLGCVYSPDVRWVHQEFWPNAVPVVDAAAVEEVGSKDWDSKQRLELAPRLYYVSGFESERGASIVNSVERARSVVSGLRYDYLYY